MTGLEGGNRCILVVDNSPDIRRIVARALIDARYAVLEAEDGARALEILEYEGVHIDLVLTDIKMPRVDGVELGRRIADRQWQVPMIYMSGSAGDSLVAPLLRRPFSMDTLMGIVDRVLRYSTVTDFARFLG